MLKQDLLNTELREILAHIFNSRLPGSLSSRALEVINSFDNAYVSFMEAKSSLHKQYGLKDESGNLVMSGDKVVFPNEVVEEFTNKWQALISEAVLVEQITMDEIKQLPSIKASEIRILLNAGLVKN